MSEQPDGADPTRPMPAGSPPPPNPYGSPPPQGSTPPPQGSTPPPYGTQPPQYGTPPPYYGSGQFGGPQPYGTPPAYGSQPAYGAPPPAYGAPRTPESDALRNRATVSLVLNVAALLFCLGLFSLFGAVCAGMAMSRAGTDITGSRRLLRWSWGLFAANFVLYLLIIAAFLALALVSVNSGVEGGFSTY